MNLDRRAFVASVGGSAALAMLGPSAKADALEGFLQQRLNEAAPPPAWYIEPRMVTVNDLYAFDPNHAPRQPSLDKAKNAE